jgi:hypothetical protein
MNRKAFLATIAAAIAAPFATTKPKPVPQVEEWIRANPALMETIIHNAFVRVSKKITVKGDDLFAVIDKETRHRAMLHKGMVSPNELRDHFS